MALKVVGSGFFHCEVGKRYGVRQRKAGPVAVIQFFAQKNPPVFRRVD
jgi:hypothetical protein